MRRWAQSPQDTNPRTAEYGSGSDTLAHGPHGVSNAAAAATGRGTDTALGHNGQRTRNYGTLASVGPFT